MNKLFILMGKSASGKSTLERKINEIGLAKKVISSTTRKPRSYEEDGVDYYFINRLIFNTYLSQNQFLENSEYTTVDGKALYGINKNDVKLNESNYICVVNPHGMRQIVNNLGKENCVVIYIDRSDRERLLGSLNRDVEVDVKEVIRRYEADNIDFKDIEKESDYIIDNNKNILDSVINLMEIIKKETE